MHRTNRFVAIPFVAMAMLAAVGPALAAQPPADVVFDGTVTVVFTDQGAGALPDAEVTLVARRPDLGTDDVIQELESTTNAEGVAVFSGVARPADGAPPVTLDAQARLERPNGCGDGTVVYHGAESAAAALEVTIQIEVDGVTSSCRAVRISGTVVDADGEPFEVASAIATVTEPDGSVEEPVVSVGPDGAFAFFVKGWSEGTIAVALIVTSEPMTVEDQQTGCKQLVELVATASWELPGPTQAPPVRSLVAEPVVLSEACGSHGTPAPPAPTITLPPTDTVPSTSQAATSTTTPGGVFTVVLVILIAALLAALTAASANGVSRRGN